MQGEPLRADAQVFRAGIAKQEKLLLGPSRHIYQCGEKQDGRG